MTQRVIGIDILNDSIRAVQMVRDKTGIHVEKAMAYPARRSSDDVQAILLSLTRRHGFDAKAEIAVALDYRHVFFKKWTFAPEAWEQFKGGDITDLQGTFPLPSLELVVQVCDQQTTTEGHEAILTASSGPYIRDRIRPLTDARLRPSVVDSEILAIVDATQQSYPESVTGTAIVLYCEESHISLAITEKGHLRLIRNTPVSLPSAESADASNDHMVALLTEQIRLSWERLRPDEGAVNAHLYLVLDSPVAEDLAECLAQELDCPVQCVEPGKGWSLAAGVKLESPLTVACGLAWRALNHHSVNFLSALPKTAQHRASIHRELTVCTLLVLACCASWFGGMFMQLRSLQSTRAGIQEQIEETFKAAVPGEANPIKPVAQMQQQLEKASSENAFLRTYDPNQPGMLTLLQAISETLAANNSIRLNDILITDGHVRLQGHGREAKHLSEWERTLKSNPRFTDVTLQQHSWDKTSGTSFTVTLSVSLGAL